MSAVEETAPARGPLERQLNVGLMVVQVFSALLVVYAVVLVAVGWEGDGERGSSATLPLAVVLLLLPGVVVFFVARSARRRLAEQVASARLWSVLAGVFALMAGLPLVSTVFGVVGIGAGLFTLTAALLLKREHLR